MKMKFVMGIKCTPWVYSCVPDLALTNEGVNTAACIAQKFVRFAVFLVVLCPQGDVNTNQAVV